MSAGIYCIENNINNKKYIEQGKDVEKRMNQNHSDESKEKMAKSRNGNKNHNYGKTLSSEYRNKISKSRIDNSVANRAYDKYIVKIIFQIH